MNRQSEVVVEWMEIVAVLDEIFGCLSLSSQQPIPLGPQVYVWQLVRKVPVPVIVLEQSISVT